MSFLTLTNGLPNFSKAVISLWFRVPAGSIAAATEAFSSGNPPPLFNGIIPLVVMGSKGFMNPFTTETTHIEFPEGHGDHYVFDTTPTGVSLPTDPVIIGVNCDPSYGRPVLYLNFETNLKAAVSDYRFELRNVVYPDTFTYVNITEIVTDLSAAIVGTNIYLGQGGGSGADQWHHLLMSLDLSNGVQTHGTSSDGTAGTDADYVDSAARLFVALDDVNYTEFDLSNFFVNGSADPNAVIPELARNVAGAPQALGFTAGYPATPMIPIGGIPQYVLDAPEIPCRGNPLGLPGMPEFVENVYRVEMAEFQMWTGITLDTGIVSNRRAFIDADGNPVLPEGTETDPRGPAEKLLGKKPDIMLHGSSDWIAGKNTGSSGVDKDGNIIEGGQFQPTGGIEAYTPDPSLHSETA